jgi:hypothetical protein
MSIIAWRIIAKTFVLHMVWLGLGARQAARAQPGRAAPDGHEARQKAHGHQHGVTDQHGGPRKSTICQSGDVAIVSCVGFSACEAVLTAQNAQMGRMQ